ncbi:MULTISPECIES: hypothetical protein [Chitinophaga]|uniref:hypothetical protein n=1 Tax=Chitinophaga TaxID=79328 RepID=UPI000DB9467D|nr:hypothetical protein [Chitinophaga ginsengisegetis]MDR6565255.1 hypothetical protein [Chitinophaga ginsengisegetis]MDR6644982.1 hypothetical protein [Chitinophaga ginsengisegetis]MDR6652426.1 hypothetical protein [Chitinophaga ginsengisegetis]
MKRLLICFFFLAGVQLAHAQYYKTDTATRKGFDPSRLVLGGSLGMVFGDVTNVDISPLVGYRFSDYIAAGVNINAQYGQYKLWDYDRVAQRDKYTIFGGGIWGRVYPIPMVFIHIQPEYNFVTQNSTVYPLNGDKQTFKTNYGVPSLLVGAGYTQSVGGRVGIGISILYDVIQDNRSPYNNSLIYRVGAGLGF